jgi:rhodanese-related sulfurtransferase
MENQKKCECKESCTCTPEKCSCDGKDCSACSNDMVTISAEQLKDKIEYSANFTIVNVLEKEHYDDCHIKGSINAPLSQFQMIAQGWDKTRFIVVYCASKASSASKKAYDALKKMGFQHVAMYEGGTREWKEKDFNTNGECSMDYLK